MGSRKTSIYRQSGVVPFRIRRGRVEIMLVSSRNGRRWVVPKGIIEPSMSARQSAKKEAFEEAGIEGKLSRKSIGSFSYTKWESTCEVQLYEMKVERQLRKWQESIRTRRWFSVGDAVGKVNEKQLKQLIREVGSRVAPKKKKD